MSQNNITYAHVFLLCFEYGWLWSSKIKPRKNYKDDLKFKGMNDHVKPISIQGKEEARKIQAFDILL